MTPLQESILKAVAYFEVFAHPVSAREIYAGMTTNSVDVEDVRLAAEHLVTLNRLRRSGEYFYLSRHAEDLVARRLQRERIAATMMKRARRSAALIRRFPFVRGVFLSGELSKNVASEKSDVDFLIVTAPGRLWVCRALLILFKKTVLLNRRKYFCLNHFVSEASFEVQRRNLYVAMEIATLKPLSNGALFKRFAQLNGWVRDFLPNARPEREEIPAGEDRHDSRVRSLLERFLEFLPLAYIDRSIMSVTQRHWNRKYPSLSTADRNERFQSTADISTAYGHDYQRLILDAYVRRLRNLGLAAHE